LGNKKKISTLLVMFIMLSGLVFYAALASPPQVQQGECDDHDHEQVTVLEGEINQIDQSSAKFVTIQLEELNDENCANQIANQLVKLEYIGKIRCDMTTNRFDVQFDSSKIDEQQILSAFIEADHPGKIAADS